MQIWNFMTAKQKTGKVEKYVGSHNFVLSRSRFILSTIIGFLTILFAALGGYLMAAGNIGDLIHLSEIIIVFGITFGGLVYSYRASAFRPWLVPLGFDVPQEELIIKDSIDQLKGESTPHEEVFNPEFSVIKKSKNYEVNRRSHG